MDFKEDLRVNRKIINNFRIIHLSIWELELPARRQIGGGLLLPHGVNGVIIHHNSKIAVVISDLPSNSTTVGNPVTVKTRQMIKIVQNEKVGTVPKGS